MLHVLEGIAKLREVCPLRNGPPNGPFASRVSATRHGVAETKRKPSGPVRVKAADAAVAALMVRVQVCVPAHAPPHPVKVDPDAGVGVAVSVIVVPLAKLAAHVPPQLIDPSLLVTVPLPAPDLVMVRTKVLTNVAFTVCAEF